MVTATIEKQAYGNKTEAYTADPSQSAIYEFRYKLLELDDAIASPSR